MWSIKIWYTNFDKILPKWPGLKKIECFFEIGLFDRPAPKTWHSCRTVIIGDACHPILPFMAQGAAMAIEDAYVLASSLENKTSIEAGLNLFQQKRQNRVKNLYDISRRNAALYHASGIKAVARNTLFAGARMFPPALTYQLDRVYGLNVTKWTI